MLVGKRGAGGLDVLGVDAASSGWAYSSHTAREGAELGLQLRVVMSLLVGEGGGRSEGAGVGKEAISLNVDLEYY